VIDRADAGVRFARGAHSLEPSIEYFYPKFDRRLDSSTCSRIDPTTDLRLAYARTGAFGVARDTAGCARTATRPAGFIDRRGPEGRRPITCSAARWRARLDALWTTGYGGRRLGGSAETACARCRPCGCAAG